MSFFNREELCKLSRVEAKDDNAKILLGREGPQVDISEVRNTFRLPGITLNSTLTGPPTVFDWKQVPFKVRYLYVEKISSLLPTRIELYTPISVGIPGFDTPTYWKLFVGQVIPVAGFTEAALRFLNTSGAVTVNLIACSHDDIFPSPILASNDYTSFGATPRPTPITCDIFGRIRKAPFMGEDQTTVNIFTASLFGSGPSGAPVVVHFGAPDYRMLITDIGVLAQGATQTRFVFDFFPGFSIFVWEMSVGSAAAADLRSNSHAFQTPLATDGLGADFRCQIFQTAGPATWRITARGFFEDWSRYI